MIINKSFEELVILPTLALRPLSKDVSDSHINISVEFKLGIDSVVGFLVLDEFDLKFQERMELLSVLSESLNIFIGKILSDQNSQSELSSPKLINLDRKINFIDNSTWYKFSLVYEESIYPVILIRRGYL